MCEKAIMSSGFQKCVSFGVFLDYMGLCVWIGVYMLRVCVSACSVTCLGLSSRGGEETATAEAV